MQFARLALGEGADADVNVLVRLAWEILGALAFGGLVGALFALYLRYVGREVTLVLLGVCVLLSQVGSDAGIRTAAGRHGRRAGDPERRGPAGRRAEGGDPARSASGARRVLRRDRDVPAARRARSDRVRGAGARRGADRPDSPGRGGRAEGVGDRPPDTGEYVWTGLISQAGITLGLASVLATEFPTWGSRVQTLLIALIAIDELIGPRALPHRPGARGRDRDDDAAAPDRRVQQRAVSAQLR